MHWHLDVSTFLGHGCSCKWVEERRKCGKHRLCITTYLHANTITCIASKMARKQARATNANKHIMSDRECMHMVDDPANMHQ